LRNSYASCENLLIDVTVTIAVTYMQFWLIHFVAKRSRGERVRSRVPERPLELAKNKRLRAVVLGFTTLLVPPIFSLLYPTLELTILDIVREYLLEISITVALYFFLDVAFRRN
jgi:hypothetical protein